MCSESDPDRRLLVADRIAKSLRGRQVLDDASLTVAAGSIHALVGMNGSGKTTLMRIALGMLSSDAGSASLFGTRVGQLAARQWAQVGQLIESPAPYPDLTTRENLTAAARMHGMARAQIPAAVDQAIDDLGLRRWQDDRASRLSLGTRQKVALAQALVHRPQVLVLDEPANALDPRALRTVRALLTDVAGRGGAVLVSSHHLDEMARVATEITVLHRGRVVGSLEPGGHDLERSFFDLIYDADQQMPEVD